MPQRPPYLSVALISGAALAYEILLMRLFSIIQWHHFSYMIIGLALLGYGFSGTVISVFQRWLQAHFTFVYLACLLLFGLTSVTSFMLAQAIPFNAEMILWDSHQLVYLLLIFLLLSLPFFFAATAICLAFMQYRGQVSRIYAWDLAGAGMGSLAVIGLLFAVFPQYALLVIAVLGLLAFLVASMELRLKQLKVTLVVLGAASMLLALAAANLDLQLSPYKGLPQTLRISGTEVIEQDSSPFGLISIVDSKTIPFRYAPGLSLASTEEPLPQVGIFTDGDNMTVITKAVDDQSKLTYMDQVTSALPYHLVDPASVLIVGAGGGTDILQALYHSTPVIDAVELNPQLIDIVGHRYSDFNGALYQRHGVNVHAGDVRGFLSRNQKKYDLIQLSLMDAFNASASGLYALNEDYLYTVEALQLYLDHLTPGGYLALTRWVKMPPRDTLKLFATAIDALKLQGVENSSDRLALIRSWQTSTLLIRNGAIKNDAVEKISKFSESRSFDVAYAPGMPPSKDSYNQLPQPWFQTGTAALLSDARDQYIDDYKFDLKPAIDDRPYFHHFTKWTSLPEIFRLRDRGGMSLIEWGYIVLVMTLLVAAALSVVLITLPLRFLPRLSGEAKVTVSKTRVILYFLLIGVAFLFMEIAFMQKFILFLHHPLYSFAVTLTAFLVFAGLGSNLSANWSRRYSRRTILKGSLAGIVIIGLSYLLLLDELFVWLSSTPIFYKILLTILLVSPLALLMGMPFPLALSSLAENAQVLIPWAWGINGCASVISASLATLLAIHIGFSAVIFIAVLLYASVLFVYPSPERTI
ncbi:MAG TPA: SAM-dependent methyltransferase [Gammaproteobacteria bacterium]|nr:SAM-dependent methyltransferase [Gammaproteobacteria bacterium]